MNRPDNADGHERREAEGHPAGEISRWEWVAGAIGLLLVLASIAYMTREAMRPPTPPRIVVTADSVTSGGRGYLVHFTARNDGRATAASVTVEGEIRGGARSPERSAATIDFVPGGSSRSGGLYFASDPGAGDLVLRALGYAEP